MRFGALVTDFVAGTEARPQADAVDDDWLVEDGGRWWVRAQKVAYPLGDGYFAALTGWSYPSEALAACQRVPGHEAPVAGCTCGFHAIPHATHGEFRRSVVDHGGVELYVLLGGRVVVNEMDHTGVLFRAAHQRVVRVYPEDAPPLEVGHAGPGRVRTLLGPAIRAAARGGAAGPVVVGDGPPVTVRVDDDDGFGPDRAAVPDVVPRRARPDRLEVPVGT